jgi:hypothetical protein
VRITTFYYHPISNQISSWLSGGHFILG